MSNLIVGNSGGGPVALLCLAFITAVSFLAPTAAGCGLLLAACVAAGPVAFKPGNGMGQAAVLGPLALVGMLAGLFAFIACFAATIVMIGAICGTGKGNG